MRFQGSIALLAGAPPAPLPHERRCGCGGGYGPLRRASWRQSFANCLRCGSVLCVVHEID